jgi:hypothetical protein
LFHARVCCGKPYRQGDGELVNPWAVEQRCQVLLSAREAVQAAHIAKREATALVARSRGKPYLATELGERTITN